MERLNGNQIFWLAVIGMIGLVICIATGHNGPLVTAFISINAAVFTGTGLHKIIKRGGNSDGQEEG